MLNLINANEIEKIKKNLTNAFWKVKQDVSEIKRELKEFKKQQLGFEPSKRKPIIKPVVVKQKIFRSIKERKGRKKQEIKLAICNLIKSEPDLCTIEIEEKIKKEFEICRATFYNYLRSLKDKHLIKEKNMDGNKGYIIIGEKLHEQRH